MQTFRYNLTGQWYKGNTHTHSTASDGGLDFVQLADLYAGAGFDFLFRTDHWVCSDAEHDPQPYPLLWLDGIEFDGTDDNGVFYHVVGLGRVEGIRREDGMHAALRSAREQGALLIQAHPAWCGNELHDWQGWRFDGVEVYNHVCRWLNGKGDGLAHWNAALAQDPGTLGLAVDDTHLGAEHPGWNGGWLMVNAAECTRPAILHAIRRGDYYASTGPEFLGFALEGNVLTVRTSPVRFIRLVGPRWHGMRQGSFAEGGLRAEASFILPAHWDYLYLEIEDECGRRAWTNHLWV
jgi:hypothetical protein